MVSEWIDDSSHAPTILVSHRPDDRSSCCNGSLESGVRIVDGHHHSNRTSAKRLGAEIQMFWRLIREPKLGVTYGQLGDHRSSFAVHTMQFLSPEGCFVEFDRPHPVSN